MHIILGSYGIVPDEPKPDFDFQREFCFPRMLERSINTIIAKVFVY
jgi:hypothetical protein